MMAERREFEVVSCNLCGKADTTPLYTLPDRLLERKDVVASLVRCRHCGLVYQNPRPVLSEMIEHYPREYELYTPGLDEKQTPWLLRQAYKYGMEKRRRFVMQCKVSGRLLDVGCATGLFLRTMRANQKWDLYGVEISPHAVQIARDSFQLNVVEGTLEQAAFPDCFFDVITMWDVFEHLHDPARSLREVFRILKSDGSLILRVPNGGSWDAKLFGRYWAGLEPPRHLYVFTPDALHNMLKRNGFDVVRWTSASGAYTTFVLSLKFWLRDQWGHQADVWVDKLYHPVMRVVTAPVFALTSLRLHGPLLVVMARKQKDDA